MSLVQTVIQRGRFFLDDELWTIDPSGRSWWWRALINLAQVLTLVVRGFITDGCMLRASALTFATLLSLVPLLALMFSLLKGLGVQNDIEHMLLEQFTVGGSSVVTKIVEYINNTKVARLGSFGLVFLIITVLALLSNIEKSFNRVWGVKETRPLLRRFTDYFSVITIGPVFVVVAISMTGTMKSQKLVQVLIEQQYVGEALLKLFEVLPFMVMWLVFAGLYLFMPNVKVSPRAALIGGVFGGTLWQISQWGYLNFQVGVARYNAIYGTMAALPILMVWIYLSWMIVLLGLEMTYATQNFRSIRQDLRGARANFNSHEFVALTVLLCVGRYFFLGKPGPSHEELIARLELPSRLLHKVLDELVKLGFVSTTVDSSEGTGYQPARALEKIELYDVLRSLEAEGADFSQLRKTPEHGIVADVAEVLHKAENDALAGMTLRDMVLKVQKENNQLSERCVEEEG